MYQNNYDDVPTLSCYEDAVNWEKQVQPIQGNGRNAGIKPMGNRRRTHFSIHTTPNSWGLDDTPTVYVQLYNTNILQFEPDRIGININGWGTQTTIEALNAVLPRCLSVRMFDHRLWLGGTPLDDQTTTWLRIKWQHSTNQNGGITQHSPTYTIENPLDNIVHKIDRKAAKQARAIYKPLKDYLTMTNKLRGGEYTLEEFLEVLGYNFSQTHYTAQRAYTLPDEEKLKNMSPDELYEHALSCALASLDHWTYFNMRQRAAGSMLKYGHGEPVKTSTLHKTLEEAIRHKHADTMFVEEVSSSMKRDNYAKYFK